MEEIAIWIMNNKIALDERCWSCDGGRKEPSIMDGEICMCGGKKFILTDAGESIIDLVKRHKAH